MAASFWASSVETSRKGAPELAQISSAVDYMLAQQETLPAVAVDRHRNLLQANARANQ